MTVKGTRDDVIFEDLKSIGLGNDHPNSIFMKPVLVGCSAKAPTKKSKKQYTELTIKLAFAPEVFKEPESIHALVANSTLIRVDVGVEKRFLSEKGAELADQSTQITQDTLEKYPELKELYTKFMRDWKAAYQSALAIQDSEAHSKTTQ